MPKTKLDQPLPPHVLGFQLFNEHGLYRQVQDIKEEELCHLYFSGTCKETFYPKVGPVTAYWKK